jgi:hypothetical protein
MGMDLTEKVARALQAADTGLPVTRKNLQAKYVHLADIAMKAMHSPTKEMVSAGLGMSRTILADGSSHKLTSGEIKDVWEAMIEAALSKRPSGLPETEAGLPEEA